MNNQQLEIALPSVICRRPVSYRQRRASRARWWFGQMRRIVNDAVEPTPIDAAEQTALPLARNR
jgi:hypothetical protein